MQAELRARVLAANLAIGDVGLVTLTFGNVSGVDRAAGRALSADEIGCGELDAALHARHFAREHGPNRYYGQR